MDNVGSNFGGGGQLSLLGHEHVPSSFGAQGSKSNCSSFKAAAGFWETFATGMLLDSSVSAEHLLQHNIVVSFHKLSPNGFLPLCL